MTWSRLHSKLYVATKALSCMPGQVLERRSCWPRGHVSFLRLIPARHHGESSPSASRETQLGICERESLCVAGERLPRVLIRIPTKHSQKDWSIASWGALPAWCRPKPSYRVLDKLNEKQAFNLVGTIPTAMSQLNEWQRQGLHTARLWQAFVGRALPEDGAWVNATDEQCAAAELWRFPDDPG